ncbi:hypothetical protein [Streptomyces sp. NPDC005148]
MSEILPEQDCLCALFGPPTQLAVFTKTAEDDIKKKEAKAA